MFNKTNKSLRKEETQKKEYSFFSLSPTDQIKIEDGQHYFEALNWALTNRKEKDIKNIALTGPYGSGKSSILKTFQRTNENKELHFLSISLATFKYEKKSKDNEDKIEEEKGESLQRLIELSILQQLFYKEKDEKLPDSRLRKITSFSDKKLFVNALFCVLFIISLVFIFKLQILTTIFPEILISKTVKNIIHYISLSFCIVGFFLITRKSIRIFHNLKISKLNIKNAEIEINPEFDKSVLNHNIEEILYFFEVTDYNVVIIEDLDRFEETEIFTKLREVNFLINNSKKINKEVVFIYVIRDEIFADKDRTKFFDFIIPVIPIINTSNSNEIFSQKIKEIDNKISDALIDDISLFIDEMRVLYNIVNEFQVYRNILDNKLNSDKLLAMIVYKNICPRDFVELSNYKGELYGKINKRLDHIREQSEIINEEIAECKKRIKALEELKIKDIKELRALYILQYVNKLKDITSFYINNQTYNFDQVLDDEIFAYFIANNVSYNYYVCNNNNYYYNSNYYTLKNGTEVPLTFKDIEKQVDAKYTYKEREQLIKNWNNDKVKELKEKITLKELEINELQRAKISKLLSDKNITIETNDNKQKLIHILLCNGYIAEDYLDYISLFHEGSISKHDYEFLLNVKSQTNTDFNYNIDHIENLIKKIDISDFRKEYILNYKLVDFILANKEFKEQREAIFMSLKNESDTSIRFIYEFINNGVNIKIFIQVLCHYWSNIWHYLYQQSNYPEDKLKFYFELIISNASNTDIKSISDKSNLKQYIAEQKNFCNIISDKEKSIEILKILDIKFEDLDLSETSEDLIDYIYQNNHYKINKNTIKAIIQSKGNFNQFDFDTRNYYAINNSACIKLIDYINSEIISYINNVYMKLDTNIQEHEECLIELLNNDKLEEKDKTIIIQKVKTKISDLSKIDLLDIENILLQNSKIKPIWKNLIDNFVKAENEISESVVVFLNNIENAELLSKTQIEENKPDKETINKFLVSLLLNEGITNDSYSFILNSVPYFYSSLNFESLSKEKVELLINKDKLELTEGNYSKLANNFENLHVLLVEQRRLKLPDVIDCLVLKENDIFLLLKSTILSLKEKESILNHYSEANIISSSNILDFIGNILLKSSHNFNIGDDTKKLILTASKLKIEDKIRLFNNIHSIFNNDEITEILQHFPEPYVNITEKNKNIDIPQNAINANFVRILKGIKYIKNFRAHKDSIAIYT